ncbi:hypothetical protein A9404_08015 [Halothiobacillus diazotrophicus]|uniref:Uncharacterized protein n=1 Tax=Halothiobacillus diazotrophicus TaxID=1860122 RepID=A0A191ZHK9_9GAMM|nr:hypothetical protein [Halothiobacillus diazotrophicus]ANJ67333.1 hypothetical protein A9404_08015 [Halothiobacillus diazotrophicus]
MKNSLSFMVGVGGVLAAPLWIQPAMAGSDEHLYLPTVEQGVKEIELHYGHWNQDPAQPQTDTAIGFGYGVNAWWFTEVAVKGTRANGQPTAYEATEWENRFQLTEPGRYPVDVGFLLEIERPRDHAEGWEVKYGPLFQTEFGKIQLNANLLFERHVRGEGSGDTEMGYQWQAKYRWREPLEFGLQGFGEFGKWNDWAPESERGNRVGPAVFGKLPLGGHRSIGYNVAWLIGTSSAAPSHNLRAQVEYEF